MRSCAPPNQRPLPPAPPQPQCHTCVQWPGSVSTQKPDPVRRDSGSLQPAPLFLLGTSRSPLHPANPLPLSAVPVFIAGAPHRFTSERDQVPPSAGSPHTCSSREEGGTGTPCGPSPALAPPGHRSTPRAQPGSQAPGTPASPVPLLPLSPVAIGLRCGGPGSAGAGPPHAPISGQRWPASPGHRATLFPGREGAQGCREKRGPRPHAQPPPGPHFLSPVGPPQGGPPPGPQSRGPEGQPGDSTVGKRRLGALAWPEPEF